MPVRTPPVAAFLLLCAAGAAWGAGDEGAKMFDGERSRPAAPPGQGQGTEFFRARRAEMSARLVAIMGRSGAEDVSEPLAQFEKDMSTAGLTVRDLGFASGALAETRRRGYQSAYREAHRRAMEGRRYGDVERSLRDAERYASLAGVDPSAARAVLAPVRSALGARRDLCSTRDLRPRLPPARHQGESAWCYAYTAADLLSFKAGRAVSALDLALLNDARGMLDDIITGDRGVRTERFGSAFAAAEDALARGVCWESDVSSEHFDQGIVNQFNLMRSIEGQTDLLAQKTRAASDAPVVSPQDLRRGASADAGEPCSDEYQPQGSEADAVRRRAANHSCLRTYAQARLVFPLLTRREYFDALLNHPKSRLLLTLADRSCRRQRLSGGARVTGQSRPALDDNAMAEHIDRELSRGNIVAVLYNYVWLVNDELADWRHAQHASTVVGRRWNEEAKTCQYLLRDSYGSAKNRYRFPSEEGHYWVPPSALIPSIRAVVALE